ncbi:MAG: leucine-rich repeat protein [Oscillospiraceae bacterium]|nr:leucine-rich repeat protein [Oscillospiraceae bacterium]
MGTKRILSMILSVVLLVGLFHGMAQRTKAKERETSGTCGTAAFWEMDPDTGLLRLYGSGIVKLENYARKAPWDAWNGEIREIRIEDGITRIPAGAFSSCEQVQRVTASKSLEEFSYEDFQGRHLLREFVVDESNGVYGARDGILYTADGKTLLCCPGGYRGIYTIPEEVTEIEEGAFAQCRTLLEVVIPESVTEIKNGTFAGCASLGSVRLPKGLKTIRQSAFENCISLKSIDLPEGLTTIESGAFGYTALEHVKIPDSVTRYRGAFGYCSELQTLTAGPGILTNLEGDYRYNPSLQSVKVSPSNPNYYCDDRGVLYDKNKKTVMAVPNDLAGEYTVLPGVEIVDYMAFANCRKLRKVTLPESVNCIGEQAFAGCKALEEVNLPKAITWIGMGAFSDCVNLRTAVLSAPVEYMGEYVFSGSGLREFIFPEGTVEIPDGTFYECESLKKITVPQGIRSVVGNAFEGCVSLEEVQFPASLESLSYSAFRDCRALKRISFPQGTEYFYVDASGAVYSKGRTLLYHVPASVKGSYTLPETVDCISDYAFLTATFEELCIPEGMIEYDILHGIEAPNLKAFRPAEGNPAFSGDEQGALYNKDHTNLLRLPMGFQGVYHAPETLCAAEGFAFEGCKALTEVHFGKNFGDLEFQLYGLRDIPKLFIPEDHPLAMMDDRGVIYIKDGSCLIYAPKDLSGAYTLPETVVRMDYGAFAGCNRLTGVDLSKTSLKVLPEEAFVDCTALREVQLPESLHTIMGLAFRNCTALTHVVIPEGVEELENAAFAGCTALREVTLPSTLKTMGNTFDDSKNLKTVRFMGDAPVFSGNPFVYYDSFLGVDCVMPKVTVEYSYDAEGFSAPYWMGVPTRVFSETALNCNGQGCSCTAFTDIPAVGHWAHNAIEYMLAEGLLNGVGKGRFNPDGTMTRAMLVTVLYRSAGEPKVGVNPFTDVPADTWYTDAVTWAAEEGIVEGVGKGLFAPNRPITREQAATILARYSGNVGGNSGRDRAWLGCFTDSSAVSDYARDPLAYMVGQGVINGKGIKLDPQGTATRAEVATILWRMLMFCVGEPTKA